MVFFKNKYSKILIAVFIIITAFMSGCTGKSSAEKTVKFIAIIKNPQPEDKVFITGNNDKLSNWNPGKIQMERISDSIWSKTFSFKEGENIEYKITGGSWWETALNSRGLVYDNFKLKIENDTIVKSVIYGWLNRFKNGSLTLIAKRFLPQKPFTVIDGDWLYHPGDNMEWAEVSYNDSGWVRTDSYINWTKKTDPKWENIGWFRFHIHADSSLWNKTLAISIEQLGASQIYYNGRLLYSFGKIGGKNETYIPTQNRIWKEIKIDPEYDQLLAVRYANYNWKKQIELGFLPGFAIYIKDVNTIFQLLPDALRSFSSHQMVFTFIPLILFLLHLFIYGFYPKQKQNLFYAFCLLGFAGITYFGYEKFVVTNPAIIILFYQLNSVSIVTAIFFGLLTTYEITHIKLPKRWWAFLGLAVVLIYTGIFYPVKKWEGILNYVFFGLVMIDGIVSVFSGKKSNQKGSWILLTGFILINVFVIYQILIDYAFVPSVVPNNQVYVYGMLGLAVSMSVFLSYNFAYINKNLEIQLENVKQLSEKALEQGRIAGKLELERKIIEVENDRKTKELESAREFQLSLLPKEIPQTENYNIACTMETATEVGGDYYDFFISEDNVLTTITGDATGHGLKAGNMVIAIKGLLNILYGNKDLTEILNTANQAIKKMNLNMLTMSLSVLRIDGKKLEFTSAGMPPLMIYRKQHNEVEHFILKAMPLGAFYDFPYKKIETTILCGDIILLCSDGLTELFNQKKENFGIEKVEQALKESADRPAEEIISYIIDKSKKWSEGFPLKDDLTLVIIKIVK